MRSLSQRALASAVVLGLSLVGALAFAPVASADAPTSLGVSGWQVYPDSAIFSNPDPTESHGDPGEYAAAPAIPAQTDPNWADCGTNSPLRTSPYNGTHPLCPSASTIGMAVGSILSGCWSQLNFTWFQALVSIPAGTTVSTFSVNMSGADDGARISLVNSSYPNGVTPDGGYIDQVTGQTTGNLASDVAAGEVNRVVITQVDDCAVGNNLNSAQIVLNGTVIPLGQTISFTGPGTGTMGGSATLSATGGGSGNPVVFSVDPSTNPGVCSVSGTNGTTVNYAEIGNCVIDANQAAGGGYNAAGQAQQTIVVNPKQTVSCTTNASVFNTGYDASSGGTLLVGATDANWVVAGPYGAGSPAEPAAPPPVVGFSPAQVYVNGAYYEDPAYTSSQYIGGSGVEADYYFQYAFTLEPSVDPANFSLNLDFYADNQVAQIYVNGDPQLSAPQGGSANDQYGGFYQGNAASTTLQSDWHTGTNTIGVDVLNGGGPYAFDAQMRSAASCEPTAPSITNLPGTSGNPAATFGGSGFTATVGNTNSDGVKSVTSDTPSVCTATGTDGLTIAYGAAGTCTLTAHVAEGSIYLPADGAPQSFSVSPAGQTVSITTNAPSDATYGGATYTPAAHATSGLAPVITIDSSSAGACSIDGHGVVSFTGVGTCTLDANQPGNTNYSAASQAQQSFSVGQAGQTVSFTTNGPTGATYGGATYTPAASSTSGLAPVITVDSSSAGVCSIDSNGVVSFTGVGTCILDANQPGSTNYSAASQAQQSFSVGQAGQTVSFTTNGPTGATYGGATYTPAASSTSGLAPVITVDSSSAGVCSIDSNGVVSFTGVGTCILDANQPGSTNYSAASQAQQSFSVGQAGQTVSFTTNGPTGATYGGATYTPAASSTSGLPPVITVDSASAGVCSIDGNGVVSFTGVGTCTLDANQPGNTDYSAAAPTQQSFTVAPAALTISADNQTMVYGGALPTLTASYQGLVNGDTAAVFAANGNTPASLATVAATSHVGSYAITVGGAVDPDYTINYAGGTLTINPATLTISADNQTMVYGGALPTLTASYQGLVNGDTAAVFSANGNAPPSLATVAATSHVGGYAITVGGAVDPDYTINYAGGILTINPANLTISADNQTMVYGGALPTLTASYQGLVNGDTAAVFSANGNSPPSLATVAATSHVGGYAITVGGAVDPDYTINYAGGTLTINPANLTISADNQTMTYGGALPTLTASYQGLVNGDTAAVFSANGNSPPSLFTVPASSPTGSYAIVIGGAADPDYGITFVPGTLTIKSAPLTITASSPTMSYEGGVPAVTPSYNGLVNHDGANSLTTGPSCSTTATNSSAPGTYVTSCSGAVDANYTISYTPGALNLVLVLACPNDPAYGTGPNYAGAELKGKNLKGDSFVGADFAGADLAGVNLEGADLEGADLEGANLQGTNLQGANLTGTNFVGATVTGANMQTDQAPCSDLQGANIKGSNLQSTNLRGDNLSGDVLQGANLQSSNLTTALLTNADLTGVNLQSDDMTGARLTGAALKGANTKSITWSNTVCPDGTNSSGDGGSCNGHL